MSTTDATAPAVPVTIRTTGAQRPCGGCGVIVDRPDPDAIERRTIDVHDHRGRLVSQHVAEFAACPSCTSTAAAARHMLAIFPAIGAETGSSERAFERMRGALAVGDLLGVAVPIGTEAAALRAVAHLAPVGEAARYAADARAHDGIAVHVAWQHVREELRQAARDASAALLRSNVHHAGDDSGRLYGPPADSERRGCLYCGIDRAAQWWGLDAPMHALGGGHAPEPIGGHLCDACADALRSVGSVGRTSMMRALLRHLRIGGLIPEGLEVRVIGFGALPEGTPPSAKPWGHVDENALRADLRAEGVR